MTQENIDPSEVDKHDFPKQFPLARIGKGSDYMNAKVGLAFAEYALARGYGVSRMEGYGTGESRGKYQTHHLILGIDDPGENWRDHRDPIRALNHVKERFLWASEDGIELMYKFWIDV